MAVREPSLYNLFTRSGYGRRSRAAASSDDDAKNLHDESERFAVAAIAFCMRHDRNFKARYWEILITRFPALKDLPLDSISVEVEPRLYADLLLRWSGGILVVEHKLGAELLPHQDPSQEEFQNPGGYGPKLIETHGGKDIYYVVLGAVFESSSPDGVDTVHGIRCTSTAWNALLPFKETPLQSDLYDCLGTLGVSTFALRTMQKNLKLAEQAQGGALAYEMLGRLCEDFGVGRGPMRPADTGWGATNFSFGGDILANTSKASVRLKKLLVQTNKKLGWVGYEKVDDVSDTRLLVLLYCGDEGAAKRVLRKVETRFGDAAIRDGLEVRISLPSAEAKGDELWFRSVLDTVIQR